ncbi:5-formyltetrahydrofolate cyclo-ligase [Roseovarius ramblicola]|uniref:5-formyltetrahydrofolate cyclo-ligase n=1 Tax=Roseovarius ramblicola TaxID=2022336 RepID=A0ABV5HZQ3_9RHOB
MTDDDPPGDAPCFAHHLVGGHVVDAATWRDVNRFRKAERARLYAARRALSPEQLRAQSDRVAAALDDEIGNPDGRVIAGYWPIRGEPDLRPRLADWAARGAVIALPVVIEKGAPVAFHRWQPGCAMTRGIWNIPVPARPAPVHPDLVIVPLLGVDAAGYRLGNGGGYYDMTLATLAPRPRTIGVGHDFCGIDTIYPQPWDIPMDRVILGTGLRT